MIIKLDECYFSRSNFIKSSFHMSKFQNNTLHFNRIE